MQVYNRDEVIQMYMYFIMNPATSKIKVEQTDDYFNIVPFSDIQSYANAESIAL